MKKMYLTDKIDEKVKTFYDYCIEAMKTKEGMKLVERIKNSGIFYCYDGFDSCKKLMYLMKHEPDKVAEKLPEIEEMYQEDLIDTGGYVSKLMYEEVRYTEASLKMYDAKVFMEHSIERLKILEKESNYKDKYINPDKYDNNK